MMNTRSRLATLAVAIAAIAALIFPHAALAGPGAGIEKGTMPVPSSAHPGATYNLDPIKLFNTGDAAATYEMLVVPVNKQGKLTPEASWFTFTPQKFDLAPGENRVVQVTMKLPASAGAGSYEALLGGRPIRTGSGVFVNVGAAARLKLEVARSNFFAGTYYGSLSFVQQTAPWSYLAMAAIVVAIVVIVFLVVRRRDADEYEDDEDLEDTDAEFRAA